MKEKYIKFILFKENLDTTEALALMSKYLRFFFFFFFFLNIEEINNLNQFLSYCSKPLRLGDLQGNRFILVLRFFFSFFSSSFSFLFYEKNFQNLEKLLQIQIQ